MKLFKKLKKSMRRATAILLTTSLTMCGINIQPLHVAAAENTASTEEYVSDVMLYQGTLADAQSKYPDYTFVKESLSQGGGGAEVHLGYQTTTIASEAIRDIACMQMAGNYNTSDYDKILEEQREHLEEVIEQLQDTITEFRINYEAGQQRALDAYEKLNKYYEEDTGLKMADFFLNTSGKVEKENYITLFLEGDAATVSTLESILASATDAGNTLWLDRLVAMGDNAEACLFDGLVEAKMGILKGRTGNKAAAFFADLYSEDIELLNNSWEPLREGLQEYADCGVSLSEDDKETIEAYMAELEEEEVNSSFRFSTYGALYELLAGIEYGSDGAEKKSLVDLFLKYLPVEENAGVAEEDLIVDTELYAIIGSWTDGQRFAATTQGITELFWSASKQAQEDKVETDILDIDPEMESEQAAALEEIESTEGVDAFIEAVEDAEGIFGETTVEDGALSVYAGVDRSFFDSKIAMTCDASGTEILTGESAFTSINGYIPSIIAGAIGVAAITGGLVTICMASRVTASYFREMDGYIDSILDIRGEFEGKVEHLGNMLKDIEEGRTVATEAEVLELQSNQVVFDQIRRNADDELADVSRIGKMKGMQARIAGAAIMAIGLILTIYSIVTAIDEYNEMNKNKDVIVYTPIPDKMVDQSRDEDGTGPYTYYSVVRNQDGNAMDLNNWSGRAWLALYTTKSKEAGTPILAKDFGKVCIGSEANNTTGMEYIHRFGQITAQNLVEYSQAGTGAPLVYFFFEKAGNEPGSKAASIFGGGNAILFMMSALMLALGVAGGFMAGSYVRKRKENVTS